MRRSRWRRRHRRCRGLTRLSGGRGWRRDRCARLDAHRAAGCRLPSLRDVRCPGPNGREQHDKDERRPRNHYPQRRRRSFVDDEVVRNNRRRRRRRRRRYGWRSGRGAGQGGATLVAELAALGIRRPAAWAHHLMPQGPPCCSTACGGRRYAHDSRPRIAPPPWPEAAPPWPYATCGRPTPSRGCRIDAP